MLHVYYGLYARTEMTKWRKKDAAKMKNVCRDVEALCTYLGTWAIKKLRVIAINCTYNGTVSASAVVTSCILGTN